MSLAPYRDVTRLPEWLRYFDHAIQQLNDQGQDLMARFDDITSAVSQLEQAASDAVALITSVHDELAAMVAEDAQLADLAARLRAASDKLANARAA